MNKDRKLTPKQEMFVREYLVDLNATQAAIRAGYAEKTARQKGCGLLTKINIQEAVQAGMDKRAEKVEVNADTVLRELLRLATVDVSQAFDDDGNLLPIKRMPEDVRRAISGLEINELFGGSGEERCAIGQVKKVRFWDKKGSLELLGKHLKLFVDRVEERTIERRVILDDDLEEDDDAS